MVNILFLTNDEYRRSRMSKLYTADAIVVDGILVKNRFGPDNVPYEGHFGWCGRCGKEIKQRELATSTFIGCMC